MIIHQIRQPIKPQLAERWVMYTIVTPVIESAIEGTGMSLYFEYAKMLKTNSSSHIDIAILRNDKPVCYVEAKKFSREITARMVMKYLDVTCNRGIVTNGNDWILVVGGKIYQYGPIFNDKGYIINNNYMTLVNMLNFIESTDGNEKAKIGADDRVKNKASQIYAAVGEQTEKESPKSVYSGKSVVMARESCRNFINNEFSIVFLDFLVSKVKSCAIGYIDVTDKRFVWRKSRTDRFFRLDFSKKTFDLLVSRKLINYNAPIVDVIILPHSKDDANYVSVSPGSSGAICLLVDNIIEKIAQQGDTPEPASPVL